MEINPKMLFKVLAHPGVVGWWSFPSWSCGAGGGGSELCASACLCSVAGDVSIHHPVRELQEKQTEELKAQEVSPKVYFMKQTIGNSCGTIRLIHTVANNQDKLEFKDRSVLKQFLLATEKWPLKSDQDALKRMRPSRQHMQLGAGRPVSDRWQSELSFCCCCFVFFYSIF